MATLHNRLCKAEFYSDPDLLSLPRDVRLLYRDLWHIAEDSGCLEDSPFGWKIVLYPSPLDADVTVERLAEWRDALIDAGKVVAYEVDGKRYLHLVNFLRHQCLTNPKRCELPLPPWVTLEEHPTDNRKRSYKVTGTVAQGQDNACPVAEEPLTKRASGVEQPLSNRCATVEQEQNRTEPKRTEEELKSSLSDSGESDGAISADFEEWWQAYGRVGDKARARDLYLWWRRNGEPRDKLLAAAVRYTGHCVATDCKLKHAATFLARPTRHRSAVWPEWAEGEPHGSMDARRASRLGDVLAAGAKAFGLTGGDDGRPVLPDCGPGAPAAP